ncbi:hypothetical protein LSH36_345g01066 [Paralvinella palmiformis]|uniref:Death domain-containing protein n=1 Tax=Paralvinella palmiformis TaxID=53620 RepID=A0AAD9N1U0_9ANNE|nr:hypothetical protein LSH36_345g01066 [Paralvinella palmiformis]
MVRSVSRASRLVRHYTCLSKKSRHSGFSPLKKRPEFEFTVFFNGKIRAVKSQRFTRKINQEIFHLGEALCFAQYSDLRTTHPLKMEKRRFLVFSNITSEGYPRSYQLDFYKNEIKYKDKSPCHHERLNEKSFCGLVHGTKNGESSDWYVAMMFTTFTIIITLEGSDKKKTESLVRKYKTLFQNMFGNYKYCRIKFENCPQNEKKNFMKESTGYTLLTVTSNRISICSETFFHVCLYSWLHTNVRIEFESPRIRLNVYGEDNHPGIYIFHSRNCLVLKESLSLISDLDIYTPELPWQMSLSSSDEIPSQSSLSNTISSQHGSILTRPKQVTTETSSLSENQLDTSGYTKDTHVTTKQSTNDSDLEFSFDLNDYISKNRKSVMQVLKSDIMDQTYSSMSCLSLQRVIFEESNQTRQFSTLNMFYDVCERFCFWMSQRSPGLDTLNLNQLVRFKLCTRLYGPSYLIDGHYKEYWEVLAEDIGVCTSAIQLIRIGVKGFFLPYPAAEIVIRHWQFMYNRYDSSGPSGKCPVPCTTEELKKILNKLNRLDLVELITSS